MKLDSQKGFTLIEVMISMAIMSFLTVLISTSIRTAVQNKKKLEAKLITVTTLYDTLRVIKLDVERAFHYQDVFYEIEQQALKQLATEKNKVKNNNAAAGAPQAPPQPPPQKLTHFLGEPQRLDFTSLNHFRTKYNAQESNQVEVGYYVDSCKSQDGKGSSKCLWRRVSTQIDDKVDEDGAKVVVAEGVETFNLEYRSNKENDEWVKQWRSDRKGRPKHINRFPHFVKIELEISDQKKDKPKKAKETIVVKLDFPNNEPHLQQAPQVPRGRPQ